MKSDLVRLSHIQDAIRDIEGFVVEGDAVFFHDTKTQWAVLRGLEIIGEAVRNLSDDCKVLCPDIPWADIIGTRNVLIHQYFGIDLQKVWATVQVDLPPLKEAVDRLVSRLGRTGNSE